MGRAYETQHQHIHFIRRTVGFASAEAEQVIGRLPDRSLLLLDEMPFGAFVETGFTGGGSDLLDIGYAAHSNRAGAAVTADPDNMATDLDISSTGWKPVDEAGGADRLVNCDDGGFPISATYADASSNASAGSAEVVCSFIPNKQSPITS